MGVASSFCCCFTSTPLRLITEQKSLSLSLSFYRIFFFICSLDWSPGCFCFFCSDSKGTGHCNGKGRPFFTRRGVLVFRGHFFFIHSWSLIASFLFLSNLSMFRVVRRGEKKYPGEREVTLQREVGVGG
ncbi:hypothetical protein QBC46DRAFT_98111 [Diplogelasinospora grovesii]|uniref:Uncharacterized protein n=1 Tax=Diplogelasinospora grovesii TaxID=303347 RepID=A0AAN6NCB8_9PEZI|nr:hypothetical protein QBC46DRAFT_98111 [Diplogelasinospora grovesii]